ncbi:Glycerophosphocholine phosphodiesterase gpcpd1 [Balamuthia mandrillaris]
MISVKFIVRANTKKRELVALIGSNEALGSWQPDRCILLNTSESAYPEWSTSVSLPLDEEVEYKYLIVAPSKHEADAMIIKRWESIKGENRRFVPFLPKDGEPRRGVSTLSDSKQKVKKAETSAASSSSPLGTTGEGSNGSLMAEISVDDGEFGRLQDHEVKQVDYVDEGWLFKNYEMRLRIGYRQRPTVAMLEPQPYKLKISSIQYHANNDTQVKRKTPQPIPLNLTVLELKNKDQDSSIPTVSIQGIKQPSDGWEWKPGSQNIFWGRMASLEHGGRKSAILVEVFPCTDESSGSESEGEESAPRTARLGSAVIVPSQIRNRNLSCGAIISPVMNDNMVPIGEFYLNYLIIRPFFHPINNLSKVWGAYWDSPALNIGHRGAGAHSSPHSNPTVTENTIYSFIKAAEMGAHWVEFDVQLTKDRIPIIYHNYTTAISVKKSDALLKKELRMSNDSLIQDNSTQPLEIAINKLTLQQIRSLRLDFLDEHDTGKIFARLSDHIRQSDQLLVPLIDRLSQQQSAKNAVDEDVGLGVPTLQEVFDYVPEEVGLNIEVKYPVPLVGERDADDWEDRNEYADAILKVVFDNHNDNRKIVFSTFDPDMATILRKKQPKYPVLFLTTCGNPKYGIHKDMRCNSLEQAVLFAKSEKFLGIVANSKALLEDTSLISFVKQQGLILFTWGEENNLEENVILQKQLGVDAVINDNFGGL